MDDNNPIIYGLEFQSRALTSQGPVSNDNVVFYVATQSLKPNNQIHKILINEEEKLESQIFAHDLGEVWKLNASPHDAQTLASCYSSVKGNTVVMETAILTMTNPPDHNQEFVHLKAEVLKTIEHGSEIKTTEFHPENPRLMASVVDGKILVFNRGDAETSVMVELNSKGISKFGGGKWSKHNSNQFLALYDCNVKSYDIRDGKCSWTIEDNAGYCLRDLDCNANKSFHIVTGGDDGSIKFWDTRNVKESVMARKDHSHWVFCVRFNTFHDEFVLSSSSDGKVLLTNAGSVSSVSSEAEENGGGTRNKKHGVLADGLLQVFDQHEDESVYCVEWSHAEPWIFASLSYDGRVIVTKVPKQYRYQILSDI